MTDNAKLIKVASSVTFRELKNEEYVPILEALCILCDKITCLESVTYKNVDIKQGSSVGLDLLTEPGEELKYNIKVQDHHDFYSGDWNNNVSLKDGEIEDINIFDKICDIFVDLTKWEKLKDIKIYLYRDILFRNKSGINNDTKGSDQTLVKLDYNEEWRVDMEPDGEVTFYDLANAIYRIRSHKFDKWYEMYGGVKITVEENTIYIDVSFNHGS